MQAEREVSGGRLLFTGEAFDLFADMVVQGDDVKARVDAHGHVHVVTPHRSFTWKPGTTRKQTICYESDIPVLNAVYGLAVHELEESISGEGYLSTGQNWVTLWTRDTSYSAFLGLSISEPRACIKTLEARLSAGGEIEQDTGTGGSWPVSSDRVVWGVAAWELYLTTGDVDWLEFACRSLEETCLHDAEVLRDLSGTMRGESSFLDWREQSYPCWMTPADIAESSSLSTMVLHRRARGILAEMYEELGRPSRASYWKEQGEILEETLQDMFWMPYYGQYGQFLYGRGYPVLSERTDTLGQSLAVLLGIARGEQAANIVATMPRCPLGVPCFYPFKSDLDKAYHNEGMWPFVEGYYTLAAGAVGNEKAMMAGIASLVRAALVSGTNKENVHIVTGLADDMYLSSDKQLWSIAGMLGMFYKGLFGMRPTTRGMLFEPCVPSELEGTHSLTGIEYRGMTFDIRITGSGAHVKKCLVNGEASSAFLPCDRGGHYTVEIELERNPAALDKVGWSPVKYDLSMPRWDVAGTDLSWQGVAGADYYRIYRNGIPVAQTEETSYLPMVHSELSHYQVMAASLDGRESFLNEPREHVPCNARVETRPCGLVGDEVWISKVEESENASFYEISIGKPGVYRVDAYFANGMESLRDGNTCALRSLMLNGERVGSLVMPHMSERGDWEQFGYSAGLEVPLSAGTYTVELIYHAYDENINHFVNDALIKNLRFTRISL